jgi:hydrogenase maturation protein HypF
MVLESVAAAGAGAGDYRFDVVTTGDGEVEISPAPVLAAIVRDLRAGVAVPRISAQFHSSVADVIVRLSVKIRADAGDRAPLGTVALGGGVFQNARLLSEALRGLRAAGFEVLVPRRLPPNDGGIALGQVLVASAG